MIARSVTRPSGLFRIDYDGVAGRRRQRVEVVDRDDLVPGIDPGDGMLAVGGPTTATGPGTTRRGSHWIKACTPAAGMIAAPSGAR